MSSNIKEINYKEKEAIDTENPSWIFYEEKLLENKYRIPLKEYKINVRKGLIIHRRIEYSNFSDKKVDLFFETNFPKLLFIKTRTLSVPGNGKDYIRLNFMIPDIYCKLTVKVAVLDREEKIIKDCLIFEINVMNS